MIITFWLTLAMAMAILLPAPSPPEVFRAAPSAYFRINQQGYLPHDAKEAFLVAVADAPPFARLIDSDTGEERHRMPLQERPAGAWLPSGKLYRIDFSEWQQPGNYRLEVDGWRSPSFVIGEATYQELPGHLLHFMRQQRCGYNPELDMVCHQRDGRTFYGALPDSTYLDVSGGWHDAGDQLKYLITSSLATAGMLRAYEAYPEVFGDAVNALGQPHPNGSPDVLDEARWGLEWIMKCHARADVLVHQVADDRDHIGWKWPDRDSSDYGWGPNSYRAAYIATGRPQGLNRYQSQATGLANIAGRSAAALALGYRVWNEREGGEAFARRCLDKARSVYALGRRQEGYQQGNSYGAPYRYNESTWADDMEWGAAALYAATGEQPYLEQAKAYARQAATTSWMPLDTADHYRYYPFVNYGHAALFPHVEPAFQDSLAAYFRQGIEACAKRATANPYRVGVPFIWCSNNLVTALMTQIILYEAMTGDRRYHELLIAQRDWLLGRNPWGTSMFTGLPADGEYPQDVHTSFYVLTRRVIPGGLVDGPVRSTIFRQLKGLTLLDPDEFAPFQNEVVVYHDDIGDYSTNEPTMDGTAGALFPMAFFATGRQ